MAPQLHSASLVFAALSVLVIGAHAQTLIIKAVVPFHGAVPSASTVPGLAGFKDRFLQAWQGSLTYINDVTGAGLESPAPALAKGAVQWTYTATVATAVFTYTEEYKDPIMYLIASPTTFYYYDNRTNSAGYKLINIYKAYVEETTFDISNLSPPPSPPGTPVFDSPPPSPPPPIFPRSPPSPKPPSPPPPSPVRQNGTVTMQVSSSMYSTEMPLQNDTANFTEFQISYYVSFAIMMDCALNNTVLFNGTNLNGSDIFDICKANRSLTNTTQTPGAFQIIPNSANWTQYEVPEFNVSGVPITVRRRALLAKARQRTSSPGNTWNTTVVSVYDAVNDVFIDVYIQAQAVIINGQRFIIFTILVFSDFALVQVGVFILADGGTIGGNPGYSTSTGGVVFSGRRRLIERRTARVSSAVDTSRINWAEQDPSDIAYGTDKSLYEIFSLPTDYYTAGAACAARGSKLASYSSEGAQIFIDILCDGAAGMQCWVEGNSFGACSSVSSSSVHQLACKTHMPFVCVRDSKKIKSTAVVAANAPTFSDLVAKKPSDVAYDINKNLYEIFSTPVDFFTAGSVCMARGATLANYGNDAAQVIVDVLCEADAGQSCWVEGNNAGKCTSLKQSDVHQGSCGKLRPFICAKAKSSTL